MRTVILILLALLGAFSMNAQTGCSGTSYLNGFTCVQAAGTANGGAGTTATATMAGNTTAGNTVVVFAGVCADASCGTNNASGITLTVANGASDSSTQVTSGPFILHRDDGVTATSIKLTAWVFSNVSATTTFTVTATGGTPFYLTTYASEWSGITNTSPWDVAAGANPPTATNTTATVTTGTTTNATDLVLGFIQTGGVAITPGAGFGEISEPVTGIQHEAKSVTSTGAQSCTWSWTGNDSWQGLCVTLKASGGGGGGSTVPKRGQVF